MAVIPAYAGIPPALDGGARRDRLAYNERNRRADAAMRKAVAMRRTSPAGAAGGLAVLALLLAAAACGRGFEPGPLGAVEIPPGEPIEIRTMQSLHDDAPETTPVLRGVTLAIEKYGPIHGREVSLGTPIDAGCTEGGGLAAAQSVAAEPQVVGVVGTTCSVAAIAGMPLLSEAGLSMISPGNTAPSLTSDLQGNRGENSHPGYYRAPNNDLYEALAAAQFAYNQLGLRTMAVIHDDDPYTIGLGEAFADAFANLGGRVPSVSVIPTGSTELLPALTEAAAVQPDGLYFPLFGSEAIALVQQIGQVPGLENAERIGGAGLLSAGFLGTPESVGIYAGAPESVPGDYVNEATGESRAQFSAGYQERYGGEHPSAYTPHAYDATTLLLRAIDEIAVAEGGALYIDRAALREALSAISEFRGLTGDLSCDEFGDCGSGRVDVIHHTDSSITDIAELPVVYRFAP